MLIELTWTQFNKVLHKTISKKDGDPGLRIEPELEFDIYLVVLSTSATLVDPSPGTSIGPRVAQDFVSSLISFTKS